VKVGLAFDHKDAFVRRPADPPDAESEWDSEETIALLEEAIRGLGHEVVRLGGGRDIIRLSARGSLGVDLVFNICEGRDGRSREAQVPAILELLGIPYTGSDPLTMAVSLDKGITKRLLRDRGVATTEFAVLTDPAQVDALRLRYPLFTKPIHEGTGKGITSDSVSRTPRALMDQVAWVVHTYHQPALVEEFLPGREFTVGVLGNGSPEALGTMEVLVADPAEAGIYSSSSKAEWERKVRYRYNGDIEPSLRARVEETAVAAFKALECRDFGRIDLRCDASGVPNVMEVNPLAGLSPVHSDLCFIARESGMPYHDLIGRILEEASLRTGAGVTA
jgi:D-alanine-D-alanine ligase